MSGMKVDVCAFGAHPDDVELSAGGTLAKLAAAGRVTAIVDLTQGELGTRGSAALRLKEATAAAQILGLAHRENLQMADGFFEVDEPHLRQIIEVLRRLRPDTVLANALSDRHPDHGRGAELIARACFLSGLRRIETHDKHTGQVQEAWRPGAVWHYIQDRWRDPDFVVNIAGFEEVKEEAILAFGSQFHKPGGEGKGEPETPISSPEFLETVRGRALAMGRAGGIRVGEGFEGKRPPAIDLITEVY
jgi:bacillithiol biosynthesis deacetylase BshB1